MPNSISKYRKTAFLTQKGLCHYCGSPMWMNNADEFAQKHSITKKAASSFQCTAEHLTARCDGGKNNKSNIVAACLSCNQKRHRRKTPRGPAEHRKHIQSRIKQGKWYSNYLQHMPSNITV